MKLKIGDIFTIPITDTRIGIGKIINRPNKDSLLIVVYDVTLDKNIIPGLKELCDNDILLLGHTLDAKLYHKHWAVIGNYTENITEIYLPYYKLGTPPSDIYIVNYKGECLRRATIKEFDALDYQSIVAPIRYEKALKAHFNLLDWDESYDALLYSNTLDSIKLVK
jgi:hypothetical protein